MHTFYIYIYNKTRKENTVRDEANLIATSELSNMQFNALIRVSIHTYSLRSIYLRLLKREGCVER